MNGKKYQDQSPATFSDLIQPLRAPARLFSFGTILFRQHVRVGITQRQYEQLQRRLGVAPARAVAPAFVNPIPSLAAAHRVILGVDPSLRGTGYGVIRLAKPHPVALDHGTISCPPAWERSRCLVRIMETLRQIVRQHQPTVCVIEGLFYAQNLKTAIVMGEARGAALAVIAEAGLEIFEMAPRKVKQAVVGYGGAQKIAVAKMVQRMVNLPELPAPDAADALALALAHAQENSRYNLTPPKRL